MFGVRRGATAGNARFGFTLVDLVVAVLLICFFIALALFVLRGNPSDAPRRNQCANNLKQLAIAALNHESAKKFLPTGGWGHNWIGDPDAGFGEKQPGGWAYSIMFFLEANNQIQQASNLSMEEKVILGATLVGAGPNEVDNRHAIQPVFYCPSRRPADLYPFPAAIANPGAGGTNYGPTYPPYTVAKSDYAANGGTIGFNGRLNHGNGPNDMQAGELAESIAASAASLPELDASWYLVPYGPPAGGKKAELIDPPPADTAFTGVVWYRSPVTLKMIPDGASKVYLFGEKYMDQLDYPTSFEGNGDEENLYVGMDDDNIRLGASAGMNTPEDAPRVLDPKGPHRSTSTAPFGIRPCRTRRSGRGARRIESGRRAWEGRQVQRPGFRQRPHAGAFNMAFCDGSVHAIAYDIDPKVHAMLCDRQDGEAVDRGPST